jgi:ABC-type polysaccharide/polyol phosphate export permease
MNIGRQTLKKTVKYNILALLLVVVITQAPLLVGARNYHETIIDFLLAILIYLPLGRWLGRKMKNRVGNE